MELLCNVNGNVKWCRHYVETNLVFPQKKLNIYDPAIPLLGICPKEWKSVSRRDICPPMFIAALFTIVEMEATQVSFDEWMDKYNVVHPYYGISLS